MRAASVRGRGGALMAFRSRAGVATERLVGRRKAGDGAEIGGAQWLQGCAQL